MTDTSQDPIKFAHWVPNLSGGLVVSKIEQRTDWGIDYNRKLAQLADEHDERYRRSEEFIRVLKASWTEDEANFSGDFYNLHDYSLKPKPVQKPHPDIFQGGPRHARSCRRSSPRPTPRRSRALARRSSRPASRPPTAAACGRTRSSRTSCQYNDGFRSGLIGTPEQVARRIVEYRKLGVGLILGGFLHFQEEIDHFGREVLPIVRQLEADLGEGDYRIHLFSFVDTKAHQF